MKIIRTLPRLPRRRPTAHKGDFGKIFILAGSRGMTGAAYLCAQGALRAGAGLVLVGTPISQQPILATKLTCAMSAALPETRSGTLSLKAKKEIVKLGKKSDVVALGPGLSQHPQTIRLVLSFLQNASQLLTRAIPLVIDADGLNALSARVAILKKIKNPVILTPHPGEMAQLMPQYKRILKTASQKQRIKIASEFARQYGVIVVLKGYQTVVADRKRVYINRTGNPGLASGGSGDVLTGILAGLLGIGLEPFAAAQLAVAVHGLAGDQAAKKIGQVSLLATDLLEYLPAVLKSS